jgi:hypothetical protein
MSVTRRWHRSKRGTKNGNYLHLHQDDSLDVIGTLNAIVALVVAAALIILAVLW